MTRPTNEQRTQRLVAMVDVVRDLQAGRWLTVADMRKRLFLGPRHAGRVLSETRQLIPSAPVPWSAVEPLAEAYGLTRTEALLLQRMCSEPGRPVAHEEFASALGFAHPCGMADLLRAHIAHMRKKGVPVRTMLSGREPGGYGVVWAELRAGVPRE